MNIFEQAMELCSWHDFHIRDETTGPPALIRKLEAAGLLRSDPPDEGEVPRRQVHERHNYSTLTLYRKVKK